VEGALNGIKASNWQNKDLDIENNTITLMPHPTNNTYDAYGICLEGGSGFGGTTITSKVTDNTVIGANRTQNGTGIFVSQQSNTHIGCNTVSGSKHGFKFMGNNMLIQWWDNTMNTDNQYGLTLDNAIIGSQGNSICPSNNNWEAPMGGGNWDGLNNGQYMTNCIRGTNALLSPITILTDPTNLYPATLPKLNPDGSGNTDFSGVPPNGFVPKYNIGLNSLIAQPIATLTGTCSTRCFNANGYPRPATNETPIEHIIREEIGEPDDEGGGLGLVTMQQQLYELIQAYPNITANSAILQQFVADNQWSGLDFIHYTGQFISQGRMDIVELLLNYWTPQGVVENNYYTYFDWALGMYQNPNWLPSQTDVLTLANKCPLNNGLVVYAARNLYNSMFGTIRKFTNNCNGSSARGIQQPSIVQNIKTNKLLLFPNPATNTVNISYIKMKHIEVIDMLGRKVLDKELFNANKTQLDLTKLKKGLHIVRVTNTKNEVTVDKLIIE
jgi:hypothetical protein